MQVNTTKAVIAILAMLCTTFLMFTNHIDQTAGVTILTALVFYSVGNGMGGGGNIINRKRPEPKDPDNGPNWDR